MSGLGLARGLLDEHRGPIEAFSSQYRVRKLMETANNESPIKASVH